MDEKPVKRGRPIESGFKKTDDITRYNREYKKKQYENETVSSRRLRNLYGLKARYEIPQQWIDKYKEDVTMAIALKDLYIKIGDELFSKLLEDLGEMDFPKKNKSI
jgi:hypothetical protein